MKHFETVNESKSINLRFAAHQMHVFNPTRGFLYFSIGDNAQPNAVNAKIKIPPQSERIVPLDGVSQFAVYPELPNVTNPATVEFFGTNQAGAIGGLTFSTPVDPPVLLDTFSNESFVSRTYTVKMVGRWLRLHWYIGGSVGGNARMFVTLDDGIERYRFQIINNLGLRQSGNFADFAFRTNQNVTITLDAENIVDFWSATLYYEYLDRAEYSYPLAHKLATRGQFVQFAASAINNTQTFNIPHGFRSFAIGGHVRGNGALCKEWLLELADAQNDISYFEWQPHNYGAGQSPTDPNFAIILPGDVQNYPGGSPKGQTLPIGSVSAFEAAGPQFDYQLSRAINITVFAETVLRFTPLDTPTLFANFFIEFEEPF